MLCNVNFPDWVQALCAIATFALAISVYTQQKKIKTLSDVVNSLNDQAKISQQLLAFEIRSRINDVQPNFITGVNKWNINHYVFSLKNIGQRARNLNLEKVKNMDTLALDDPQNKAIEKNDPITGTYNIASNNLAFSFKLIYEDDNGNTFSQVINGDLSRRITITLPEKGDNL